MSETDELDPGALALASYTTFKIKEGEVLAVLMYVGRSLGLFERLAQSPATAAELAADTNTQERWIREWLYTVAAAGVVRRHPIDGDPTVEAAGADGASYDLSPEYGAVLADVDHPSYALGMFGPPTRGENVERLIEGFQTGLGMSWGAHGAEVAEMQAQMSGARQRAHLIDPTLLSMGDLGDRLEAGILVYDIGCGSGTAARSLAQRFEASTIVGIDPSEHAIAAAKAAGDGIANLEFGVGTFDDLPDDGSVGLLLTVDVLHDLTRPGEAARRARAAVADDGVWVVADIKCGDRFEDNLANPMLALYYGMSVMFCMNSALSEPGGAGLGTMGLSPTTLKNLTDAAGFGSAVTHEFDHDISNYWYEIRP